MRGTFVLSANRSIQPATISDGGPNDGYRYVVSHTVGFHRAFRLNAYITPDGDPDLWIEMDGVWTGMNRWQAAAIYSIDPSILFDGVTRHETYGLTGAIGHQDAFAEIGLHGDVCGNVGLRVERLAGTTAFIEQMLETLADESESYALAANGHHRVHSHYASAGVVVRSSTDSTVVGPWWFTDNPEPYTEPLLATCSYAGLGVQ